MRCVNSAERVLKIFKSVYTRVVPKVMHKNFIIIFFVKSAKIIRFCLVFSSYLSSHVTTELFQQL